MESKDGRLIALQNEVRVLRALHRFGWLRTQDLAALLWTLWKKLPVAVPKLTRPTASASGLRMAQRTLRRLAKARQVLRGRAPDGSLIYALAEAGERRLQLRGVQASTGKDLVRSFSTGQFRHRAIANEIAISGIISGFRVSTEREVAQDKWFGGANGIAGKKPDVLLIGSNLVWWIEVERSRKNASDYGRLLKWLGAVLADTTHQLLEKKLKWAKIVFVCTPAFHARLTRDLEAAGWEECAVEAKISFATNLYYFEDIQFV